MTRFARAKGSKASNEKAPEDGTPWEVMKEQLLQSKKDSEESKKREENEKQRVENYQNFLKEQKVQKKPATWCDFPESAVPAKKAKFDQALEAGKKKKKNKAQDNASEVKQHIAEEKSNETAPETKMPKNKKNKPAFNNNGKDQASSTTSGVESQSPKNKNFQGNFENRGDKNFHRNNEKTFNRNNEKGFNRNNDNGFNRNNEKSFPQKQKKHFDDNNKPARRKPIDDNSFQIIINGKPVELVRFDGFPVMKKDAERLADLKKNMINKGIPKSEVQRTMKLERRRAEKALARVKRDVCYNCRKGGHNLSDCPELKSKIPGVDAADGLCFKCGSTEHRQFECKVQKDKEFRFASCFICKEQGHIARQCPDNPKGLYPNGGSCKLCGDVTHLRKDCPTVMGQKEERSIKLQTLDELNNIEDMPSKVDSNPVGDKPKKPKKITF